MPKGDKMVWNADCHSGSIPLGHLAGQPVLVSIATDPKGSNNANTIWWSRPKFVQDPEQQEQFLRLTEQGPVPERADGT